VSYADLAEDELKILRFLSTRDRAVPVRAADIAPHVGLSVDETSDRLNELEWVGYVEDHGTGDGADSAFTLTADGIDAAQ
jgi:DNA-binding IclR family transcriptional regulator